MENRVLYFDQAYVILQNLFGRTPSPTDESGRLVIFYILARTAGGLAHYPITIGGLSLREFELRTPLHEIGHVFTGGGKWSCEWWAEFCFKFIMDNFGVGTYKSDALRELETYENIDAPFENSMRSAWLKSDGILFTTSEVMQGIIFRLCEELGYEGLRNVDFDWFYAETVREDAINLMKQLHTAFGDEAWAYFERWNFPVEEDTDNDGLSNREEIGLGTSFLDNDTDWDRLSDGEELALGTDPWEDDSDGDGLIDGFEAELGTNPLDNDTDKDGLDDGTEVSWMIGSGLNYSPLLYDTDNDGISDYDEAYGEPEGSSVVPIHPVLVSITVLASALSFLALTYKRRRRKGWR
jgi:hypothetical protein